MVMSVIQCNAGVSQSGMSDTSRRQYYDDVTGELSLGRSAGVSREQLDQLRQDIRSGLNDALFTRLCNMEEVRFPAMS